MQRQGHAPVGIEAQIAAQAGRLQRVAGGAAKPVVDPAQGQAAHAPEAAQPAPLPLDVLPVQARRLLQQDGHGVPGRGDCAQVQRASAKLECRSGGVEAQLEGLFQPHLPAQGLGCLAQRKRAALPLDRVRRVAPAWVPGTAKRRLSLQLPVAKPGAAVLQIGLALCLPRPRLSAAVGRSSRCPSQIGLALPLAEPQRAAALAQRQRGPPVVDLNGEGLGPVLQAGGVVDLQSQLGRRLVQWPWALQLPARTGHA
ncbi:MAG: hypothetical protein JM57_11610 [Comamonadaceae bacterium BICA1-1]|nr:MAG: hypothetical protein JM57_11610 [Comamonadaceae bacterium BICA1-1]